MKKEIEKESSLNQKKIKNIARPSLDKLRNSKKLLKKKAKEEKEEKEVESKEIVLEKKEGEEEDSVDESQKHLATIFETIELTSEFQSKVHNEKDKVTDEQSNVIKNGSGFIEISILDRESLKSYNNSDIGNKEKEKSKRDDSVKSKRKPRLTISRDRVKKKKTGNSQIVYRQEKMKKRSFSEFVKVAKKKQKKSQQNKKEQRKKDLNQIKQLRAFTEGSESESDGLKYSKFFFKTNQENDRERKIEKETKKDKKDICGNCSGTINKKGQKINQSQLSIREEAVKEVENQINTKSNLLSNLKKEGEILKKNVTSRINASSEKYLHFCEDMIAYFANEKEKYKESSLKLEREIDKEFKKNCVSLQSKTAFCDKLAALVKRIDVRDDDFVKKLKEVKLKFEMKFRRNNKTRTNFYDFFKQKLDKTFNYYKEKVANISKDVNQKLQSISMFLFSEKIVPNLFGKRLKTNSFIEYPDIKHHLKQIDKIVKQLQNKNDKSKLYKSSDKTGSRKISNPIKKGTKEWNRKSLDSKLKKSTGNDSRKRIEEFKKNVNIRKMGFNHISLSKLKCYSKFNKTKKAN